VPGTNRKKFLFLVSAAQKPSGQANTEVIEELDETGRPKQKVALLFGPPGLGKTTLAHVVAKHAGYNVVEMNASDDRSIEGSNPIFYQVVMSGANPTTSNYNATSSQVFKYFFLL
jgi:DNA polymerase III delta prime subunit